MIVRRLAVPPRPRLELLIGEDVVQAEHRLPVADGRKRRRGWRADPLRRGLKRDQIAKLCLERTQLAHQGIELGVSDLRRVEDVVPVVVVLNGLPEFFDATPGLGGGQRRDGRTLSGRTSGRDATFCCNAIYRAIGQTPFGVPEVTRRPWRG